MPSVRGWVPGARQAPHAGSSTGVSLRACRGGLAGVWAFCCPVLIKEQNKSKQRGAAEAAAAGELNKHLHVGAPRLEGGEDSSEKMQTGFN